MARIRQGPPQTGSDTHREALRDQSREVLVALLEELAARYPEVEARLDRLALGNAPATLAAEFRKRLQNWKRSRRFLGRSAASGFGRELKDWLDEVQRELLPLDPLLAHKLCQSAIAEHLTCIALMSLGKFLVQPLLAFMEQPTQRRGGDEKNEEQDSPLQSA